MIDANEGFGHECDTFPPVEAILKIDSSEINGKLIHFGGLP